MTKPPQQRLALFLDGTWNTEDDSTNVLNAYHNTVEGLIQEKDKNGELVEIVQKRYYDRGVGTSIFDSLSGGGFGIGLEKNVREAYNWLVDNYNDKDQVYIFGFSRGAYTARSLTGLIAACGLVKRGAPLTITQLWKGYAFISSNREHNKDYDWWKKTLAKEENKDLFGRITDLYNERDENRPLLNKSEKLVRNWSIRVRINYLGIYDSVGAMGIHALGIPGLSSKLDKNHNLNPSSLYKKCRHALAIDEYRTSFRLTPILDYVLNEDPKTTEFYKRKINQMWFVGAHSNIGGGYSNNVLSMAPYNWIMEGAKDAGLKILPRHKKVKKIVAEEPSKTDIRDSFAELAGKVYPHIIRAKRHFRPIGRVDLVRSESTLRPINEDIHPSVFELAKTNEAKTYAPPNLLAYLRMHPEKDKDKVFENRQPQHKWPGELMSFDKEKNTFKDHLISRTLLILWSILAAVGTVKLTQFFWVETFSPNLYTLPIIACLFILIDWGEHKVTLGKIFYPKAVRLQIFWNILFWMRLLSVFMFVVGTICTLAVGIKWIGAIPFSYSDFINHGKVLCLKIVQPPYIGALLSTIILMFILEFFGSKSQIRVADEPIEIDPNNLKLEGTEIKENNLFIAFTAAISLAVVVLTIIKFRNYIPIPELTESISGGLLLAFALLLIGFPSIFAWVGKPMSKEKANIGSIVQLQTAFTKAQVSSLLNSWMTKVHRTWFTDSDQKELNRLGLEKKITNDEDKKKAVAWLQLRKIVRESLWRDIIGFVPIYSMILGTILWIGSILFCNNVEGIECYLLFDTVPMWLCLIIFTALFDFMENWIHLIHIKKHPKGGSSTLLIGLGVFFTFMKFIGYFTAALFALAVLIYLCIIMHSEGGGFKWMIAIGITYFLIVTGLLLVIKALRNIMPK